jgi:hypothetical protein
MRNGNAETFAGRGIGRERTGARASEARAHVSSADATNPGTSMQNMRRAFLSTTWSRDALAEQCGESFVAAATTGEGDADDRDQIVIEEWGGP